MGRDWLRRDQLVGCTDTRDISSCGDFSFYSEYDNVVLFDQKKLHINIQKLLSLNTASSLDQFIHLLIYLFNK